MKPRLPADEDPPFTTYTTKTLGEDGIVRDLAKHEYLPEGVFAVNAWVERT